MKLLVAEDFVAVELIPLLHTHSGVLVTSQWNRGLTHPGWFSRADNTCPAAKALFRRRLNAL